MYNTYNVKILEKLREKIEPIWRPTIFSPVTHTLRMYGYLYYTMVNILCQDKIGKKYLEINAKKVLVSNLTEYY